MNFKNHLINEASYKISMHKRGPLNILYECICSSPYWLTWLRNGV